MNISPKKIVVYAAGVLVIAGAAVWAGCEIQYRRTLSRALSAMRKNLPALAADYAECYRHRMVKSDEGCALLLAAYHDSRNLSRMEWAAQACMEAGRETPEVYLGLAAAEEASGREVEAATWLLQGTKKFPEFPELHMRMAILFRRNKRVDEAVREYSKVSELLPQNADLALKSLEYFVETKHWQEAKAVVTRLQQAKGATPEVKLLMATALQKFGDQGSASALVDEAKKMMKDQPDQMARLRKAFPDVLK
jgi:tetratricopeptide (TPR) repeat protein